jgi:ComF family protein
MKNLLTKISNSALDLLFPMQCLGCRTEGKLLCAACTSGLASLGPPFCGLCALPGTATRCRWCRSHPPAFAGIRAPFLMMGLIREGVHLLKYQGVRAAAPEMARLLAQYLAAHPMPADLIAPVPLHPRRLRARGYNQSALLARELAKLSGLPLDEGMLARTRDTPPQVEAASREERRANVDGSFESTADAAGRAVVLVDDVATTGSTLSACAAALKAAGAASVWGLVLAREG